MNSRRTDLVLSTLVTVFEDFETAKGVVQQLHQAGFAVDRIQLVTHDIADEAPEVETPIAHETTASSIVDNAVKCGGIGAGTGLMAGVVTGFPGLALGMSLISGITGAIIGTMAGVEHAVDDDSVNLPTLDDYQEMVSEGRFLVVVQGTEDQITRAKEVVNAFPDFHRHVYLLHGHAYHEHPAS